MPKATSRAWRAGQELGKAIIEMVHLMYQNQTALAFIQALSLQIDTERDKRERLFKSNPKKED